MSDVQRPTTTIDERVCFDSGKAWTRKQGAAQRLKNKEEATAKLAEAHNEDAMRLLRYLNESAPHRWATVRDILPELRNMADAIENVHSRDYAYATINAVEHQPQPFYAPVDNSPRIYTTQATILGLPRALRTRLIEYMGWHSLDLAHAQLSIVAKVWDIPELQTFLSDGGRFWPVMLDRMGYDNSKKDRLKTALYALIFGAGAARLKTYFANAEEYARWKTHPLIQALFKARTATMKRIREQGYAEDASGKRWDYMEWIETDDTRKYTYTANNVRSIMAAVAQSYELALLSPILDIVEGAGRNVQITYYLHDGLGISCPDAQAGIIERMIEAVKAKAQGMGIATRLERA